MDAKTFDECRENLNAFCTKVLNAKRMEYAEGGDRLNNFKCAAALRQEHPVRTLCGMMVKHEASIHDMAKAVDLGQSFTENVWLEKIGDLRNYCDLLYGLLIDQGEI